MVYRGWRIKAYPTFLGYLVQYTSPIGEAHQTSPCFPTDESAQSYARAVIDQLCDHGGPRFEVRNAACGPDPLAK